MSIRSHLGIKAATVLLAVGGLGFGMMGTGVHAAFTDAGHATESVSVGTFGIQFVNLSSNCTADGGSGAWTVTCNIPMLTSSAAGSAPISFSIKDTGTIGGSYTVSPGVISGQVTGATQFVDLLPSGVASTPLAAGATSAPVNAGLSWGALVNGNEGQNVSVVYTINATA